MGSQPWKIGLLNYLSDTCSGERVKVEREGEVTEGKYLGDGQTGGRQGPRYLIVNTAPPTMGVRDEGYFDHEQWIRLDRGVKLIASDGTVYEAGPGWRKTAGR